MKNYKDFFMIKKRFLQLYVIKLCEKKVGYSGKNEIRTTWIQLDDSEYLTKG